MGLAEWARGVRNRIQWAIQGPRVYVRTKQAGVQVTQDTAEAYSAVAACTRVVAESLACLPWQVFRRHPQGREAMPGHPANWLLSVQPNPEQSAFAFRRQMVRHLLLWGNGLAEIERANNGQPVWLWPLLPDACRLGRSETGELVLYVYTAAGVVALPRANVFHIADGSHDGLWGVSRIELARRAIGVGIAQDTFAASFFGNGAMLGGVIKQVSGTSLSPAARDVMLETFDARYGGPENARKTAYLDAGMDYVAKEMPMTDAQFLESRRWQVQEIARWFGVPLHLIQDLSDANYASSYEASKNFVEYTQRPIAIAMEQEANVRLIGQASQGRVYTRMNLAALMRADPRTRGEYYRTLINAGVMSVNEVRELEELNALGPEADEHYIQTSMTTLRRVAEGETAQESGEA